jgi:hypothetical protein
MVTSDFLWATSTYLQLRGNPYSLDLSDPTPFAKHTMDIGLLDYQDAAEWNESLDTKGFGRVCLPLQDRDVLKIWTELESLTPSEVPIENCGTNRSELGTSSIELLKLDHSSAVYETLKKSARALALALSQLACSNNILASSVPQSDDNSTVKYLAARSASHAWLVHDDLHLAHTPSSAKIGKFSLHCAHYYVLVMTPRTRIIPPPLLCVHETHEFSDPGWCNLKETEDHMLLMPIGVSPVLEFSGATAVLLSPRCVFEVLCCESIPLIITLLDIKTMPPPAFPLRILKQVCFVTKANPEYSLETKNWIRQVTESADLRNSVQIEATKYLRRKRFRLSDTKVCSFSIESTYGRDSLQNESHTTRATDIEHSRQRQSGRMQLSSTRVQSNVLGLETSLIDREAYGDLSGTDSADEPIEDEDNADNDSFIDNTDM